MDLNVVFHFLVYLERPAEPAEPEALVGFLWGTEVSFLMEPNRHCNNNNNQ